MRERPILEVIAELRAETWIPPSNTCGEPLCTRPELFRVLDLAARAARQEETLRAAQGVQGTHWEGCWHTHHGCAVAQLELLGQELQFLKVLDSAGIRIYGKTPSEALADIRAIVAVGAPGSSEPADG